MVLAFMPYALEIKIVMDLSYSTWNLALEALKHCIYTIAMSMVTKFDRVMTYHEELPSIKSHDPLVT